MNMSKIRKHSDGGATYEAPACLSFSLFVRNTVLMVSDPSGWVSSESFQVSGKVDVFEEEL